MGVPGTPHQGGLHYLLELLRKVSEELELLPDMEWAVKPVIVSLKINLISNILQVTGGGSCSVMRAG